MKKSAFEAMPDRLEISLGARGSWNAYRGDQSDADARARLLAYHLMHVRKMVKRGEVQSAEAGLFVTEIPDYDLAVFDLHYPELRERIVVLFRRENAEHVAEMVVQQFAAQHGDGSVDTIIH